MGERRSRLTQSSTCGSGRDLRGKGLGKGNRRYIDKTKTMWVGGIPPDTTYQELLEFSKQFCPNAVWAEVFKEKGAVTAAIGFKTPPEAQEAIGVLNGRDFKGAALST